MSIPSSAPNYTQGFGSSGKIPRIIALVAPGTNWSPSYYIGLEWINEATNSIYKLTSTATSAGVTTPTWTLLESGTSSFTSLTGDTGTAVPTSGNIKIAGTASEITTAASGSTVTLTIPSAFVAPGSITATTTVASTTTMTAGTGLTATTGNITATAGAVNAGTSMTATLGNITATNGNLVMGTIGNKILVPTGTNASAGTSGVMSGSPGVVTVATTACSTTAKVFFCRNITGGTPGQVSISAQDGTGFTLTSTGNETSTFNWWIINA